MILEICSIFLSKVIGVEILHLGEVFPGSREELHELLAQQNYVFLGTMRKIFCSSS